MRKISSILAVSVAALLASVATAKPITLAVYGDSPYGTSPTDTAQVLATPAFVSAVNADAAVSLVLHVGDIHSGVLHQRL